jgi:predicted DNA-binding transcriptional regulator AlpA
MSALIDTGQIAQMLGLNREYVTDKLTKRPDFPRPLVSLSRKLRRWSRAEIAVWGARHGHMEVSQPNPRPEPVALGSSEESIRSTLAALAQPIDGQPVVGIYFLLAGDDVVYVGQSIDVYARITAHVSHRTKVFDRWAYLKADQNDLNTLERHYICLLRPQFNLAFKPVLEVA